MIVERWAELTPHLISYSFTLLRGKAEANTSAFRKPIQPSFQEFTAFCKKEKDAHWKELKPSLGHPQNVKQLECLVKEEHQRSQQSIKRIEKYASQLRVSC